MQKEQEAGGSGASALDPWRQAGDEWIRALTNAQNAGASLQQQHSAYEEGVRRAKDR
ncbi:MAG TPA: hypothetical protein VLB73_02300 [Patescibacteria group bacterium]|nr:hypothetical protein [Patescibacteria group bacterium]